MAPDLIEQDGTVTKPEPVTDELGRVETPDTFTFKIPKEHPDHLDEKGEVRQIEGSYAWLSCPTDKVAADTINDENKGKDDKDRLTFRGLVNDVMQARARSNAYQKALAKYKPHTISDAAVRERVIRDMIRGGIPESVATKLYDDAKAAVK